MSTALPPHVAKSKNQLLKKVKEENKQTWENVIDAHLSRSSQMEKNEVKRHEMKRFHKS